MPDRSLQGEGEALPFPKFPLLRSSPLTLNMYNISLFLKDWFPFEQNIMVIIAFTVKHCMPQGKQKWGGQFLLSELAGKFPLTLAGVRDWAKSVLKMTY